MTYCYEIFSWRLMMFQKNFHTIKIPSELPIFFATHFRQYPQYCVNFFCIETFFAQKNSLTQNFIKNGLEDHFLLARCTKKNFFQLRPLQHFKLTRSIFWWFLMRCVPGVIPVSWLHFGSIILSTIFHDKVSQSLIIFFSLHAPPSLPHYIH